MIQLVAAIILNEANFGCPVYYGPALIDLSLSQRGSEIGDIHKNDKKCKDTH